MKNGKFNKRCSEFKIEQAVSETIEIFQIQADAKGISLLVEIGDNIPESVILDKGRI